MKVEWTVRLERQGGTGSTSLYKLKAEGVGTKEECETMQSMYLAGLEKACAELNKIEGK